MLQIRVNGDSREIADGTTVAGLIEALDLPRDGVAVEVNREIVPRRKHSEHQLADGDDLEIVTFVGGG